MVTVLSDVCVRRIIEKRGKQGYEKDDNGIGMAGNRFFGFNYYFMFRIVSSA